VSREALGDAVRATRIELVLTAHPTEIVRRTLIDKHNRIAHLLASGWLLGHNQCGVFVS
jgi:phosphoenolpyruvate carboxylase